MAGKLTIGRGTALMTGAASGLGLETANAFAEAGVENVVFADINEAGVKEHAEASKQFAKHAEYRPIVIGVDVSDEASVQNMVDTVISTCGRIDYFVNSAGIGNTSLRPASALDVDMFMKTLEINVKGTMLTNRAVTKVMAEQEALTHESRHGTRSLGRGSVVNIGSVNSYIAAPRMLSYTTSKHAIVGLTKTVAIENFPTGVRVNAVCPSWIDTPMMRGSLERSPALAQQVKAYSPLGRAATVEEVADYIVFLCSPSASYINGTGLLVDAGLGVTAHASST